MCQQCAQTNTKAVAEDVFAVAGKVSASNDVLGADALLAGDAGLVLDAEAAGLGTAAILSAAPVSDESDSVGVDAGELDFSAAATTGSAAPLFSTSAVTATPAAEALPLYDENGSGDTTASVSASGNQLIDGLLAGVKWGDGYITYSDPDSTADYQAGYPSSALNGFGQVNASQMQTVHAALNQAQYTQLAGATGLSIEAFTNLGIDYAGSGSGTGTIRVANSSDPGTAYAYYPSSQVYGGDAFFGGSGRTPVTGNYHYHTVLHELGHSLGLKHGQETNVYGALPASWDSMEFSVMTYRSYIGGPLNGYSNETYGYAQTYMMLDIAALQYMYGADFGANSTNTTYTWSQTTGQMFVNGALALDPGGNRIFSTIWDGNGTDTYDLSNYTTNLNINLAPGGHSTFSSTQLAYLGGGNYSRGNVFNAMQYNGDARSLIENAIGGSGGDTIQGNAANNVLTGNGGNDSLYGYGGNDSLYGGADTDYLVGGDGTDYLYGGLGTVTSYGGNDNDYLYDGNSSTGDAFYGGAGVDTLIADFTWVDSVLYDLTSGWMKYPGSIGTTYDTLNSIENLWIGGGADVIGSAEDNYIYVYDTGPDSNNTISTLGGTDLIYSGIGNDEINAGSGQDTVYAGSDNDIITDTESMGAGDDDTYDGGAGTDTLVHDLNWVSGVTFDLEAGWSTYNGNRDRLISIENLIIGGSAAVVGSSVANEITVNGSGANLIDAGAGEDTVDAGGGNDTITDSQLMFDYEDDTYDGGAGIDTLIHDFNWVSTVKFDLNAGWATLDGNNRDRLISIENLVVGGSAQVIGSGDNNVITVNGTGSNIIAALGGNDTVYANGGDDDVKGGNGNDSLYGGDGNDSLDGDNDNDVLVGGDGNDYLLGRQGDDSLYGGAGNDQLDGEYMDGGTGNDEYRMRSTSNTVVEGVGGGIDTVSSSANIFALAANVENLILLSPAYFGYGNDINNVITGTSGKNKLDGLGGNDTVYGGGNIDYVFGGDGDDFIYGGAGNDGVFAGEGADWVFGDDGNDKVGGGAGNDFVYGGTGDDILTGDNNQDVLYGGDGNDVLDGGSVRDTMFGDAGNDLIYGGVGIDQIYGGSGNDQFVYNDLAWSAPGSADTVHDFENPGNVFGDYFNLSGIDANAFIGGDQAFSYGGSQGAGAVNTGTGYFWFWNVGNDTHLRANVDGGSWDLDIIIDDGVGLVAANYTGLDVIG